MVDANAANVVPVKSAEEEARDRFRAGLASLMGSAMNDDSVTCAGTRFVLPAQFAGEGGLGRAQDFLRDYEKQQGEEFEFSRTFPYRPYDGAAAFDRAVRLMFGSAGLGRVTYGMFGQKYLPELVSVAVGPHGETLQVPWGRVQIPGWGYFDLEADRTEDGIVFDLHVTAPRRYRAEAEAFFDLVRHELDERSIYRGKAINADDHRPSFLDLDHLPPAVYTQDVMGALERNVWAVLRYDEELREQGVSLKRAVLLGGPYGVGKSLAGALTAREAVAAGWTYILVRSGKDNAKEALNTARIYAPAVVFIEDLDLETAGQDRKAVAALLDQMDSVSTKGLEVLSIFTTNFPDKIDRGVLRPGRIDAYIEIGALDAEAFERLVRGVAPGGALDANIDWAQVAGAMEGYFPSFVVEAVSRAARDSAVRNNGKVISISTGDLVNAANDLRPQFNLMNTAPEGEHSQPTLGRVFTGIVEDALGRTSVARSRFEVAAPKNGAHR